MNDKSILDILEQDEPFKWQGKNYNSFRELIVDYKGGEKV